MFREEICRFVFKRQGKTKYCVIDNGYKTWIIPYNKMKNAGKCSLNTVLTAG